MVYFDFTDDELDQIKDIVRTINGNHSGINQILEPNDSDSEAANHAFFIYNCLDDIKKSLTTDPQAVLNAVIDFQDEARKITASKEYSNPLLKKLLNQAQLIVTKLLNDPHFKIIYRHNELKRQLVNHNEEVFLTEQTVKIAAKINAAIQALNTANDGRDMRLGERGDKKSFFKNLFALRSNKIYDTSKVQRVRSEELAEFIPLLQSLIHALPNLQDANTHLSVILPRILAELTNQLDIVSPKTISPFAYNVLSRLTADLQDIYHMTENLDTHMSIGLNEIFIQTTMEAFKFYLETPAGKHFLAMSVSGLNDSPFMDQLTPDELETMGSLPLDSLQSTDNHIDLLLTLMNESQFNHFYSTLETNYESHYEALLDSPAPAMTKRI